MSGGAISANKHKPSTYVGLMYPVIARHALFCSGSNMSAYVDLTHTCLHKASAVVLIVLAFVPYFELDNFFKSLFWVATFILVFCL